MAGKNILLIEPGYKNKYPPLGLMKLAQYHGERGKRDKVLFVKGEDERVFAQAWDRVYVTTLFSFEFQKIAKSIDFAIRAANGQADKVFVGGIAASLMPDHFEQESRWHGVRFIRGLLGDAPAVSLRLDSFAEELYSDDTSSTPIEDLIPDYSILNHVEYEYPVRDAYFTYASRGCIRKCTFCGVPKLEGAQRDTESLTAIVAGIASMYGPKKDLVLMDNNVVASARFEEIMAEIRDLGFTPGATLERGRSRVKRRVDFNQGVDARILCKDEKYLRELSSICLSPLRIAFDHLGLKQPYEKSVRIAHSYGMSNLSNYMLYNFHDNPTDLFERMRMNVALNEELGIRIYSFPMRYQPTNRPDRGFIGEHWTRYELRSMQIILQATHGVVSGEPDFFKLAFGDTATEFNEILLRPHHYIFNREWYEREGGKGEFEEYKALSSSLNEAERRRLIDILSSVNPADYRSLRDAEIDKTTRRLLGFYIPLTNEQNTQLWTRSRTNVHCAVPEEEFVEDAGLESEDESMPSARQVA